MTNCRILLYNIYEERKTNQKENSKTEGSERYTQKGGKDDVLQSRKEQGKRERLKGWDVEGFLASSLRVEKQIGGKKEDEPRSNANEVLNAKHFFPFFFLL